MEQKDLEATNNVDVMQFRHSGAVAIRFITTSVGLFIEPEQPGLVIELPLEEAKKLLSKLIQVLNSGTH